MSLPGTDSTGGYRETNVHRHSCDTALAAAGSNQGGAALIDAEIVLVNNANGALGVILPANGKGKVINLWNQVSGQNLLIYPPSGGKINDGTMNASYTLAGQKNVTLYAVTDLLWYANLSA